MLDLREKVGYLDRLTPLLLVQSRYVNAGYHLVDLGLVIKSDKDFSVPLFKIQTLSDVSVHIGVRTSHWLLIAPIAHLAISCLSILNGLLGVYCGLRQVSHLVSGVAI